MKKNILLFVCLSVLASSCSKEQASQTSFPTAPQTELAADTSFALQLDRPRGFLELNEILLPHGLKLAAVRCEYPGLTMEYRPSSIALANREFVDSRRRCVSVLSDMVHALGEQNTPLETREALAQARTEAASVSPAFSIIVVDGHRAHFSIPREAHVRLDTQLERPVGQELGQPAREGVSLYSLSHPDHPWAPYEGLSQVGRNYTSQAFRFNTTFGGLDTYEHETQFKASNYANRGSFWSSTMPEPYYHPEQPNNNGWDIFAIGSARANRMVTNQYYYTYADLAPESASTVAFSLKGQLHRRLVAGAPWWAAQSIDWTIPELTGYVAPGQKHWYY